MCHPRMTLYLKVEDTGQERQGLTERKGIAKSKKKKKKRNKQFQIKVPDLISCKINNNKKLNLPP